MPGTDQNARNRNCIEHMLKYCDQIQETLDAIQNNKEAFVAYLSERRRHVHSAAG